MHWFICSVNRVSYFYAHIWLKRIRTHYCNLAQWKCFCMTEWPHDQLRQKDNHAVIASRHGPNISEPHKEVAFEQGILLKLKPSEFRVRSERLRLSLYNCCLQIQCGWKVMHLNWKTRVLSGFQPQNATWYNTGHIEILTELNHHQISQQQCKHIYLQINE